eukprot:8653724-Alexandrium_andersonii.AAC.1
MCIRDRCWGFRARLGRTPPERACGPHASNVRSRRFPSLGSEGGGRTPKLWLRAWGPGGTP